MVVTNKGVVGTVERLSVSRVDKSHCYSMIVGRDCR